MRFQPFYYQPPKNFASSPSKDLNIKNLKKNNTNKEVKNGLLPDPGRLGSNNNSAEEEVSTKIPRKLAKPYAMGRRSNASS